MKYVVNNCGVDNLLTTVDDLDVSLLTCLHTLELRGNKLRSTAAINIPSIKNLFLVCIANHHLYR